jgi:hypothetical protein
MAKDYSTTVLFGSALGVFLHARSVFLAWVRSLLRRARGIESQGRQDVRTPRVHDVRYFVLSCLWELAAARNLGRRVKDFLMEGRPEDARFTARAAFHHWKVARTIIKESRRTL